MSAFYDKDTYNQVFDWPDTDPDAFYDNYEDNYDEYCPEGWNDDETFEEVYDEWPNRGRFGNLPSLAFLKANYVPPMTVSEAVDPYYTERYAKYEESLATLKTEKEELIVKTNKLLDELKKAEDVPKTYTAAKWGAISARDALVKRLTKDFEDADEKVRNKTREINALVDKNKNLCDYIHIHNSNLRFDEEYRKFKDEEFERQYGKVEPITEPAFIQLFYKCEKIQTNDGSDVYRFDNQVILQRCMKSLTQGKVPFTYINLTDIQV